ncbi:MAG: hypothetical protein AAF488_17420 [Planctomycetota bacterium]
MNHSESHCNEGGELVLNEPYRSQRHEREEGTVLIVATTAFTVVLAFTLATLVTTQDKIRVARAGSMDLTAQYVAQAGFEWQMNQIWLARSMSDPAAPFGGIDQFDTEANDGQGNYSLGFSAEPLLAGDGTVIGEFDTAIDIQNRVGDIRDIVVVSFGYVPTKALFEAGDPSASRVEVRGTFEVEMDSADVFDYSYFINHWGWFYGNTIVCNGNARANGQFDFGGYSPYVNGSPRYQSANGNLLEGYIDDNGDGVEDGSDGGVFASWSVLNENNVRGMGGSTQNQHEWQPYVDMPNLSDLTIYEAMAANEGGSIRVGGSTVVTHVLGDDASEPDNLYLEGTAANPIVLDGPIVARGDVILKGYVTGQGTIYAGRNVYVADDLTYLDPPTSTRPSSNDESTVEAWRAANANKDALGLFAREHVVVGDYTNGTWRHYVNNWLNDSNNESKEDAGADGIQNTRDGPDGVPGTADDDLLEGDGVWTVDYYTTSDQQLGLIPPGKSVGDVIPGSGEDIDGDGVFDPRTDMTEFEISQSLNPGNWAGLTTTHSSYSDISSIYFEKIDASFYTNHFFAALMLAHDGSQWVDLEMNGSIVSRNESIIYGATWIYMNHDERLTGGNGAYNFGLYLPRTWNPIEVNQWSLGDGASIEDYTGTIVAP